MNVPKPRVPKPRPEATKSVLANEFIKHGFAVMIGSNNAGKRDALKGKTVGKEKVGSFEDSAKFGEIVVLAVKGTAAEVTVKSAGAANLKGKTVIDAVNPIADGAPVNGVLPYFTSFQESLMERLQKLAPEANFVKAFKSVGNALRVNPDPGLSPQRVGACLIP